MRTDDNMTLSQFQTTPEANPSLIKPKTVSHVAEEFSCLFSLPLSAWAASFPVKFFLGGSDGQESDCKCGTPGRWLGEDLLEEAVATH